MPLQALGPVQPLFRPGDDARGVVLQEGGHGGHSQGVLPGEGGRQVVLDGDGKLRLTGGAHGGGAVLQGLHDGDIQPRLLKIALGGGHIKAGVVGVGGPVQAEGHVGQRPVPLGLASAGGQGQGQRQGQGRRPERFHIFQANRSFLFSHRSPRAWPPSAGGSPAPSGAGSPPQ